MLKHIFCTIMTLGLLAHSAQACSPSETYYTMPLAIKLKSDDFFIGKVVDVDDNEVTFEVMALGGPAKNKSVGDTIEMKRKPDTITTCTPKEFNEGEIWIYDGNDSTFGPSRKLEPSDLKDGYDLNIVKRNIVKREEPDYIEPRQPLKTNLPVPGTYKHSKKCDEVGKDIGVMSADYTLQISEPDVVSKNYKVDILMNICRGGHICSYSDEAPAYGYGKIILPIVDANGQNAEGCSVIIQQLSGVDDWPLLKEGEAKVIFSDNDCQSYLKCGSNTSLVSHILKKEP